MNLNFLLLKINNMSWLRIEIQFKSSLSIFSKNIIKQKLIDEI